jgi:GPR1/FUN34/yaaH family
MVRHCGSFRYAGLFFVTLDLSLINCWLLKWGVLSFCFWIVSLRKNNCLIITFALLWLTFFLLAAATHTGEVGVRKVAGYVGFLTAMSAWYTGVAEIINEGQYLSFASSQKRNSRFCFSSRCTNICFPEWGQHVLPGLKPILSPERFEITKDSIVQRTQYDRKTNTMFLQFRGIQIKTPKDVLNVKLGVEEAFKAAEAPGEGKIHVVVDYEDVLISDDVASLYWDTVAKMQQ